MTKIMDLYSRMTATVDEKVRQLEEAGSDELVVKYLNYNGEAEKIGWPSCNVQQTVIAMIALKSGVRIVSDFFNGDPCPALGFVYDRPAPAAVVGGRMHP